jgi:hypothetical protein
MRTLNGGKNILDKNGNFTEKIKGPGNTGLLFQKYMKDNEEGSYDTYRSTAYRQQLSVEEGK